MLKGLIKRLGSVRGRYWAVAQHAEIGFQDGSPCRLVVNDEDDGSLHISRSGTELFWRGE
jgi:hypothetical protein